MDKHKPMSRTNSNASKSEADRAMPTILHQSPDSISASVPDRSEKTPHHNCETPPNMKLSTVSNYIKNSIGFGHTDTVL